MYFFTSPCRPTIFATWWIRCKSVAEVIRKVLTAAIAPEKNKNFWSLSYEKIN